MILRKLVIALAVLGVLLMIAPSASAAPLLQMQVELGGRVARDRPGEEPIRLEPKRKTPLRIVVTNKGDEAANVRHVRLEGEALGLQFLTYDVSVDQRVPAGARRVITVPLDLYDLGNQATGYLPAAVRLYNGRRQQLAEQKFVVDVRGKGTSTLGIFAVALLVLAAVSVGALVYKMMRRQLSRNRAVRGLQFMLAGLAVGLLLALGLPILRITSIQPDAWIPLALGPMAIGFALGYLAPGPLSYSIEEAREDELLDIYASQALERLSAEQTAAEQVARRSGETVVSGAAAAAAHTPAAATTVVPGEPSSGPVSGPAPVTTVVPGERSSGPAPVTTVVPGERSSGPAPVTTV
ncbi:MAG: hypothetical protein WD296_07510, partial [Acidimicrobiia bacterium]